MKKYLVSSALIFSSICLLAPLGCSLGADSQENSSVGSLRMPLTSAAASGVIYRLRNAQVDVVGPQHLSFTSEDYLDQPSFVSPLSVGDYQLNLLSGWQMERVDADGVVDVDATLLTALPRAFSVQSQATTRIELVFEVDGQIVELLDGELEVAVIVNETGSNAPENTVASCTDGLDNDGDGYVDCVDFDCQALLGLCSEGPESNDARCSDGLDNDGDGYIDCSDFGCAGFGACPSSAESTPETCADGVDNDGDGYTDCADFECQALGVCGSVESDAVSCADGVDNDGDGFVDCSDFDCKAVPGVCPTESDDASCSDGVDNDGDTYVDCADFDCQATAVCP